MVLGMLELKAHLLARGVSLTSSAVSVLSAGGARPISIHEYATTGGVTIRIGSLYINAPFDDMSLGEPEALLDTAGDSGNFVLMWRGHRVSCDVLPLPGYLSLRNSRGDAVIGTTMSHGDRVRISPLQGCVYDCGFCDLPQKRYYRHHIEELLASIEVAKADTALPPRHLVISGGTPGPAHAEWFDSMVMTVAASCGLPTDVMMSPRGSHLDYLRRFVDAGVIGFSFNLEVVDERTAAEIMPRKATSSSPHFDTTVRAAVDLLGAGTGAVRSLVIVGLEEPAMTLKAVERIARLGADPVLSPFRPAVGTPLADKQPPTESLLIETYEAAHAIAMTHGVQLGPRCNPCQHNTLTLPDDVMERVA
jgi:Radical SAM superfamily